LGTIAPLGSKAFIRVPPEPCGQRDDDDCGNVRIASRADQRAKVQVEVGSELQPPIRMRDRQHALDIVRDRFGRGIGQVVDGQHDHVVAHTDTAILAAVSPETFLHQ